VKGNGRFEIVARAVPRYGQWAVHVDGRAPRDP
jgi:hypothetical protein